MAAPITNSIFHLNGKPLRGVALIGNPGTGKSTILNGVVGEAVFSAGISVGSGRTTQLQEVQIEGVSFFDTPGLNDVEKRVEAGKEIDKLLQHDQMAMKLVFVVTPQKGRFRPEDAATIDLVLDAIELEDMNNKFAIIINQAPKAFIKKLHENKLLEQTVRKQLTGNRTTSFWFYVESIPELDEAEDAALITPELARFFVSIPETKPMGTKAKKLDTENFDEKIEREVKRFEKREQELKEELERQKAVVGEQNKNMDKLREALEEENRERQEMERKTIAKQTEMQKSIDISKKEAELKRQKTDRLKAELTAMEDNAKRGAKEHSKKLEKLQKEMEDRKKREKEIEKGYEDHKRETETAIIMSVASAARSLQAQPPTSPDDDITQHSNIFPRPMLTHSSNVGPTYPQLRRSSLQNPPRITPQGEIISSNRPNIGYQSTLHHSGESTLSRTTRLGDCERTPYSCNLLNGDMFSGSSVSQHTNRNVPGEPSVRLGGASFSHGARSTIRPRPAISNHVFSRTNLPDSTLRTKRSSEEDGSSEDNSSQEN